MNNKTRLFFIHYSSFDPIFYLLIRVLCRRCLIMNFFPSYWIGDHLHRPLLIIPPSSNPNFVHSGLLASPTVGLPMIVRLSYPDAHPRSRRFSGFLRSELQPVPAAGLQNRDHTFESKGSLAESGIHLVTSTRPCYPIETSARMDIAKCSSAVESFYSPNRLI